MESNKIVFRVVAGKEIMNRCLLEINGLSGTNFKIIDFEEHEVPLCTIEVSNWKPQYIFKLGMIFQRFNSLQAEEWRIKTNKGKHNKNDRKDKD